jgi:hypothetical protein
MKGNNKIETNEIIQLHYWFKDELQGIDAFVQNRSEYEFLSIIKEIASILEIHINIQVLPYTALGVRRCFEISFAARESKIRKVAYQTIFSSLVTLYSSSTIEKPNTKAINQLFEKAVKATKLKGLEEFAKQQQLRLFKLDITQKQQRLLESTKLIKRRSNLYEALISYTRMDKISFLIEDQDHNPLSKATYIPADTFDKFILTSNILDPIVIDETVIEIIAPVLKMGNYKWKGVYDGEVHDFNMLSTEFKTLVLSGRIEFKNGSAIKCCLEICKKINNQGEEEITRYNILRVDNYFDKEKPIETPEGRKHKYKKREQNAPTLFDGMDY